MASGGRVSVKSIDTWYWMMMKIMFLHHYPVDGGGDIPLPDSRILP